ncbi:MAG TPA: hypothetical protein VFD27_01080 [Chthoniobacteraceae bacterium]|nr:hypothetical protein [Chthoniobacteraceae bacterium]
MPAATTPPDEAKPATKFTPATAKAELEEVRIMFQEFRNSLGENPVGTNAEITKALLGDNLKQVRLILPKGLRINDDGEMCDPRGIPFFFHQLSGKEMEIRSAGADEKMWTDDDIVTK